MRTKKGFNRLISTVLTLAMLVTLIPNFSMLAFAENDVTVWTTSRIGELTVEETGEGVIYLGMTDATADEKGRYAMTIYRDGYSDEAATVELHSIDVSAKIKEDYDIIDEDTEYFDLNGTVMERNANYDATESIKSYEASLNQQQDLLPAKQKSSLQIIKEEKTGIETRDVVNKGYAEFSTTEVSDEQRETGAALNEYTMENQGDFIASSSTSIITFESGQTEKQVIIEISEDDISEGSEYIMFMLSSATGAKLGDLNSATVTITDDEEKESAFIGFSESSYDLNTPQSVKVIRTGALYSVVSADVCLSNGTKQTVVFKPYDTEKIINLNFTGYGTETITLDNIKGGEEGENLRANIQFGEKPQTFSLRSSDVSLAIDTRADNVSFVLGGIKGNNDKNLRVDYIAGQKDEKGRAYAKIYDEGYKPEVYVGNYYFPTGFKYDKFTGFSNASQRSSELGYNQSNPADEPGGYGRLYWYDWRTWRNGTSYALLSDISHSIYGYYAADLRQSSGKHGSSRLKVFTENGHEFGTSKAGEFDRTVITHTSLLENNLPQKDGGYIEIHAVDDNSNRTPHTEIYFYGVAAFFRKFNISISQPAAMNFVGVGEKPPVTASLGDGHSLRYTYQALQIKEDTSTTNGMLPGELIGYKITTNYLGSSEKQKTFYYMADGIHPDNAVGTSYESSAPILYANSGANLSSIEFDESFINTIDKNLLEVSGSGTNWSTDLNFTPLYRYKDIKVRIMDGEGGAFSGLATGEYNYHAGDKLTLSGTPADDTWVYAGYKIETTATENANETQITNSIVLSETGTEQYLTLGTDKAGFYKITPVFKKRQGNYITIDDQSNGNAVIHNILSTDDIKILKKVYPDYNFDETQKIYIANPTLKGSYTASQTASLPTVTEAERSYAATLMKAITVNAGKIYQIEAYGKSSGEAYYKPTFYNNNFSSETITSHTFDYIAAATLEKNKITLGATLRNPGDEKYIMLTGKISSTPYSIRQTTSIEESIPVAGLSIYAGDTGITNLWITPPGSSDKIKTSYIERITTTTDTSGHFTLGGTLAHPEDNITLWYSQGDIEGVRVISLSELAYKDAEITFNKAKTIDDTKTNTTESVKKTGISYDLTSSSDSYYNNITTPVFKMGSPVATDLNYTYFSDDNNEMFGTITNSVAIMEDFFTVELSVDRKGQNLKKAVFKVDKQVGDDKEYTVYTDTSNPNIFKCDFDGKPMDDVFFAGDKLYVTLYDVNGTEVNFSSLDENGNTITSTSIKEKAYSTLFTGISFYIPMLETVPQSFTVPDGSLLDVPVLGKLQPSASSGVLSFSKQDWETGDVQGYSLIFDININAWNKNGKTTPAQDLLKTAKDLKNNAAERANRLSNEGFCLEETGVPELGDIFSLINDEKLKNSIFKDSLVDTFALTKMNVNVIVLMNFDFVFDESTGEYVHAGGQVLIGGSFMIAHTFYTTIYGVPVFVQLSGTISPSIQANYGPSRGLGAQKFAQYANIADAMPEDSDVGLFLRLVGKVQAGVGICGVLSARGILTIDLRAFTALQKMDEFLSDSGFMAMITGGIGVDLVLFSFDYNIANATYGCGIYEDMTGAGFFRNADSGVSIRTYNMGDGGQVGESPSMRSSATGYEVLIPNAPERTKPSVVTLADGRRLLVYIGADTTREGINQSSLYYSIYENGSWGQAMQIENDGTADGTPSVSVYGNDAIIAWADMSRSISSDEIVAGNYKNVLSEFDISAVKFDGETSTLEETKTISHDESAYNEKFMDYAPKVCADPDGKIGAAMFYIKKDIKQINSDLELIDSTASYETIALTFINRNGELHSEQFLTVDGDPLMLNPDYVLTKMTLGGEEYVMAICAYTVDADNDLSTSHDWDTYLLFHNVTTNHTYKPINLCCDYITDASPKLTKIDDSIYLTYMTQNNDSGETFLNSMCITDWINSMRFGTQFEDNSTSLDISLEDILKDSSDGLDWWQKTAAELGISEEEYKNSIFEKMYNNDFPINSISISMGENMNSSIGRYALVKGSDGNNYMLWLNTGTTDKNDLSIELYGAVNYKIDEEGKRSGWSKPVRITKFSNTVANSVIDEFTVTVDKNGDFCLVSNMYTQNIDLENAGKVEYSNNQMIAFNIDNRGILNVVENSVSYDIYYPKSNETTEISFKVKNDGLLPVNLTSATISIGEAEVATIPVDELILGGTEKEIKETITMPDGIDQNTPVQITFETQDGTANAYNTTVPYESKLNFTNGSIKPSSNNKLEYTVTITNTGNKPCDSFTLNIQRSEGNIGKTGEITSFIAPSLLAGESAKITVELMEDTLSPIDFGELGLANLSIQAVQGDTVIASTVERVASKSLAQKLLINGNYDSIEIVSGKKKKLVLSGGITLTDAELEFASQNNNIAYVDEDGYLTGVKSGETTITVTNQATGATYDFKVTVEKSKEDTPTYVSSGAGSQSSYTVTFNTNGGSEIKNVKVNKTLTEPTAPVKDGYTFSGWYIDEALTIPYDFNQRVTKSFTLYAKWTENVWTNPFIDVKESDWFYESVKYANINKLMNGTTQETFSPDDEMTRAMLVAVLYRAEGEPEVTGESTFEDIDDNAYYKDAVIWGQENGIINGYSETHFAPDEHITREQIAAIIYRYASYKGTAPTGAWAIKLDYTDLDDISDYATEAVMYCKLNGIMQGKENNNFDPKSSTTRAETSAILQRYIEANK